MKAINVVATSSHTLAFLPFMNYYSLAPILLPLPGCPGISPMQQEGDPITAYYFQNGVHTSFPFSIFHSFSLFFHSFFTLLHIPFPPMFFLHFFLFSFPFLSFISHSFLLFLFPWLVKVSWFFKTRTLLRLGWVRKHVQKFFGAVDIMTSNISTAGP
jgi:hypothetical protein